MTKYPIHPLDPIAAGTQVGLIVVATVTSIGTCIMSLVNGHPCVIGAVKCECTLLCSSQCKVAWWDPTLTSPYGIPLRT